MSPVWVALLGAAAAFAQTALSGADKGVETRTITVDGRERTYHLYRPAGKPQGPYPVVLALHGGGGQGLGMRRVGFEPVADRHGFALVYPDGHNRGWNDGRLGSRIVQRGEGVDDVAFFRVLIDRLVAERFADPARVYSTGPSNGGIMTFRLACDLADRIAAAAPVIANMAQDRMELCKPARPVPMLIINGTKDPLVPWEGGPIAGNPTGGIVVSVDRTIELWKRLSGCSGKPPRERPLPDKDPNDGTRTTELVWQGCRAELRLYRVEEGGHHWHGAAAPVSDERIKRSGKVSMDFSGAEVVWDFFSRHRLAKK
jgi:polyhydroxybutyrate depolymerase